MTKEDCENWCISLFSCVYCTFEENNCTFWTDTTYDAEVSYALSISSRSISNSSTYIKTANRGKQIFTNSKENKYCYNCRKKEI